MNPGFFAPPHAHLMLILLLCLRINWTMGGPNLIHYGMNCCTSGK
ncbi:hypothetical protein V6Z11_D13G176000 [Gossypium hirsutum]